MRLVIGSDLHSEYKEQKPVPPIPDGDMLILAGDIANGDIGLYWASMQTIAKPMPTIYVAGNHEYYGWDKKSLDEIYAKYNDENVMLLNPGVVEHEDFVIIGCTLYSELQLPGYKYYPPYAFGNAIGDFKVTRNWSPYMHQSRHRAELLFVIEQLEKFKDKRCIVVTHFVPTMQCIAKFWQGNDLNPYFVNNLDWVIDKYKPEAWVFGHTHDQYNQLHTNGITKLLCNPRGYPREKGKARAFQWLQVEL